MIKRTYKKVCCETLVSKKNQAVQLPFWISTLLIWIITIYLVLMALDEGTLIEASSLVIPAIFSFVITKVLSYRFIVHMQINSVAKFLLVFLLSIVTFLMIPLFFGVMAGLYEKEV